MSTIKLSEIGNKLPQIDLFISAISFEKRCFSFVENVDHIKFDKIWFTYNENEQEFYLDNINKTKDFPNATLIPFSTDDPLVTGRSLVNAFERIGDVKNILIDISTFTHEGLLILIKFIYLFKEKFDNIYIVYVGAKAYSLNEKKDEDKWLSKGTKTIRSVLGYPGILNPSQPNHLIILFGFELERTSKLISDFEFERVSIGIGPENTSIGFNHYAINRQRHINLIKSYPFAETFQFSLVNPLDTAKQIHSQIEKHSNYNIVITPLNNKISTVGVAFVALIDPKVQICYVRAHEYNYKAYSDPADDCYFMPLHFPAKLK